MRDTSQMMICVLTRNLALALTQKKTEIKSQRAKDTGYCIRNREVDIRAGFGYVASRLEALYSGCHL